MTDEERAIDVEGRQARLAELLTASPNDNGGSIYDAKPQRKRRSDAGTKKGPKVQPGAPAGKLTKEQAQRLVVLMEQREQAIEANTAAENEMMRACERFDAYLDELTQK